MVQVLTPHPTGRSIPYPVREIRQTVLDELRGRIRRIEHRSPGFLPQRAGPAWHFGVPDIDTLLGPDGLEIGAVHEVKPAIRENGTNWAAARATAFSFALALAVRRYAPEACGTPSGPVLCCSSAVVTNEFGGLYGPGLRALGLDPAHLIIVETAHATDTLWAIEEGLKSASAALVIGVLDEVGLTPARRLALAAAAHRSSCILLTHPRAEATAATATRWRVGAAPSALHPLDGRASGARRFSIELERCRAQPMAAETAAFCVEWCDEALCFRLAASLADRADAARGAARSTG